MKNKENENVKGSKRFNESDLRAYAESVRRFGVSSKTYSDYLIKWRKKIAKEYEEKRK